MKTCKNCSTENVVTAVKCVACNMENNFNLHAAVLEEEIIEEEKATVQCLNCGDHQSTQELQCTTCRFPLAEVKVRTVTSLSAKLGKRVG